MTIDDESSVDVVGIGFGPSNLALAIAIEEHNLGASPHDRISSRFIEKQPKFGWHRGMLLPGTTMQISFLKDLVTQRNTRSKYSFLEYLAYRGRLTHFINHQSFFPTRIEFHDYLEWAAEGIGSQVLYGVEASGISWNGQEFEVEAADHGLVRGRNLVLAGGITAKLPSGVVQSDRVFHNHRLLQNLENLPGQRHQRFAVVGSGQSAAEVTAYLHDTYPSAEIHAVFAKYGYTPADDSPYANRIFDPQAVEDFYDSSDELRQQLMDYHRGTNYSAVDLPLIEELYRREYSERVQGQRRLFVHGASRIGSVTETSDGVAVHIEHRPTGLFEEIQCDAVVYATGFHPTDLTSLLGELASHCVFDGEGRPVVDRAYRLESASSNVGDIYVQGNTEHTHGLTSTLLSNLAVRSGELVSSLLRSKSNRVAAELVDDALDSQPVNG